jgi:hypothetical protein
LLGCIQIFEEEKVTLA